ncbi:type 1 glutamine amidotransferase domain-containing protein [Pseudooceanicola sp. CBS1P-1]|uniref:Type 1 glutamine amidotransferase domain-containing protein n=1 Tax=Pseudooceanicola albus TaxID=2692189 RepID=A0A6L7FZV0_9RHOB|nr:MULTISPECIES: type 1 glutamine amidotransferase domain-containing protein [Pseudooceanicola]MBT9383495.1 type 1 glutamine amidotransferase domain-containing protein [Pseudooceanicola endophyticus]MXN17351.1 type 1 glutamine amidotransferase domain-containing protein [Pseudooceanicola albus]
MARILILSTAADVLGDTGKPTGVWYEELASPYYAFLDAGHDVTLVTLGGKPVPIDPNSDVPAEEAPASVTRFRADATAKALLAKPGRLEDEDVTTYDALYIPGGHGAMFDLAESPFAAQVIGKAWDSGKIVASVCHGPAAFAKVVDANGVSIVKGRKVTAFTDSEEEAVGLTKEVPFLLETTLRALGAEFECVGDWQPHAVADGRLVTGQNPASSDAAAQKVLALL